MQDSLFSVDPGLDRSYRPVEALAAPSAAQGWDRVTVYTDGACRGNPGPGGWAWAIPGVRGRAGCHPHTTNQRMEVQAALDAMEAVEGPIQIVSDSTYVVNCANNKWYVGWLRKGWKNKAGQPVANRDLWEPFIALLTSEPGRVVFRWVKGHASDPHNNRVDQLAVRASVTQQAWEGVLVA